MTKVAISTPEAPFEPFDHWDNKDSSHHTHMTLWEFKNANGSIGFITGAIGSEIIRYVDHDGWDVVMTFNKRPGGLLMRPFSGEVVLSNG